MEPKTQAPLRSMPSSSPPCPECNGVTETFWTEQGYRYGEGESAIEIDVSIPVHQCAPCDLEFIDHEGQRLKHEALCAHFRVLSPREIRDIRQRHGLTRAEFAKISGLGEASLGRWENGTIIQSHGNDRYLRLLAEPNGVDRLKAALLATTTEKRERFGRDGESTHRRFKYLGDEEEAKKDEQAFNLRIRKAA